MQNFKIKLNAISAVLLLSLTSFSQTENPYSVKISERIEAPKGFKMIDIIEYGKDQIICVNFSKEEKVFQFQVFSDDFKLVRENTINAGSLLPEKARYKTTVIMGMKIYFMYVGFGSPEKDAFGIWEFTPESLSMKGEPGVFFEIDKLKEAYGFMNPLPLFFQKVSADGTKLMFAYRLASDGSSSRVDVFDNEFKKLWSTIVSNGAPKHTDITNDGQIFVTGKSATGAYAKVYSKNVSSPQQLKLSIGVFIPQDCRFCQDKSSTTYAVGQYSTNDTNYSIGCYAIKLSADYVTPVSTVLSEYPSTYIADSVDKVKEIFKELETKWACITADGSLKILSEVKNNMTRTSWRTSTSASGTQTTRSSTHVFHFSENIIVTSFSPEGKVDWVKRIVKKQSSTKHSDLSFYCFTTNNDLNLFFNDNLSNQLLLSEGEPERYASNIDGYVAGVRIGANGNLSKFNLAEHKPMKGHVEITDFTDDGDKKVLNTKKTNFILVSVK